MAWTAPRTWVPAAILLAAQLNAHLRDNLQAAFPTDTAWITWTPTYANLTVGNGTILAHYIQVGKIVFYYFSITFGSTSSMGSVPSISLPVTASIDPTKINQYENIIGEVKILDTGLRAYQGTAYLNTTTTVTPQSLGVSGSLITQSQFSSTAPMTWTTGDSFWISGFYEAA